MSPKISILIPAYNAERFLGETLDSVLAQSCVDWECVCANDGSTDGTLEILRSYQAKDARIRVLSWANHGCLETRAWLLKEARGEHLFFLDADDLLYPYSLDILLRVAEETKADLVQGEVKEFERTLPEEIPAEGDVRCLSGEALKACLDHVPYCGNPSPEWSVEVWNKLIRRHLCDVPFQIVPGLNGGDDVILMSQLLTRVRSLAFSGSITYAYRQNVQASITSERSLKWFNDYTASHMLQYRVFTGHPLRQRRTARIACSDFYLKAIAAFILTGCIYREKDIRDAFSQVSKSLLKDFRTSLPPKWRIRLWLGAHGWFRMLAYLCRRSLSKVRC